MSHSQDLLAVRRELDDAGAAAARQLWGAFGRLKQHVNALCAAGILATSGGLDPQRYRESLELVHQRVARVVDDLHDVRRDRLEGDTLELWGVVRALAAQIERHAGRHPEQADALWRHAIESYAIGRRVAGRRWALEMRPEGLPLRAEALASYTLLP